MRIFSRLLLALCCLMAMFHSAHANENRQIVTALIDGTVSTFDPYDANDTLSQSVAKSVYEGLFRLDENHNIQPVLALDWEVSEDGLTYTVNLRRNVFFHDGTRFTAKSVRASFERAADEKKQLKRLPLFENIRLVEVVHNYRVRIHLRAAYSSFIYHLAHPASVIISAQALKTYGEDIARHPCGTGPFLLKEWTPGSTEIVVTKNPSYWRQNRPALDAIVWRSVPLGKDRTQLMLAGKGDFTNTLPPDASSAMLDQSNDYRIVVADSIIERYVAFNTKIKPFNDVRVRHALNYAIDKDAVILAAVHGFAQPSAGLISPKIDFALHLGPWPYDLQKARDLLTQAGYPDGFDVEIWSTNRSATSRRTLDELKRQLARVNVRVTTRMLTSAERRELLETHSNPNMQMCLAGWSSSTGEVAWGLLPVFTLQGLPPHGYNLSRYVNNNVDADIAQALATNQWLDKKALYASAQKKIWQDAPHLFLFNDKTLYAHHKKLTGFIVLPDGGLSFENAEFIGPKN